MLCLSEESYVAYLIADCTSSLTSFQEEAGKKIGFEPTHPFFKLHPLGFFLMFGIFLFYPMELGSSDKVQIKCS